MEKTLLIIKPDGVERGLVGEIIGRIERKGLKLSALKLDIIGREKASLHYAEHEGKEFYDSLINFITSSPVVLAVVEGEKAIATMRKMAGATRALEAEAGTIRGDFAMDTTKNIVHSSDSAESAEREIKNFFKPEEIMAYKLYLEPWVY
ncbi:nucleoside diphosphate kinase [Propionigenium maris DSM 9537]|uniref:Nucleoside diphosphate kinase n=1 Tax=Propionigenium maris DSM 9537 TaxID=1123000 RepID=A0A9W6GMV4_9FUSO|nr:nucleoside-diphosphate kinase [Propionigenium maris]GLI57025.1 nucleoside diphosphate kinase [Propionigenium maris DSM 9537]